MSQEVRLGEKFRLLYALWSPALMNEKLEKKILTSPLRAGSAGARDRGVREPARLDIWLVGEARLWGLRRDREHRAED